MLAELDPWASIMALDADQAAAFERLSGKLNVTPDALLRRAAECLVGLDRNLQAHGLGGIGAWADGLEVGDETVPLTGNVAVALALQPDAAASFEQVAGELRTPPGALLRKMAAHLIECDRHLEARGFGGVGFWAESVAGDAAEYAAAKAINGVGLKLRPTGFMWPADKPLPWTAEECKAAVLGYAVRWPGAVDDFFDLVRGKWEMSDGYGMLWQA